MDINMTKMTAKVHPQVWKKFNGLLKSACIARDPFLDRILEVEIPHLDKELDGKVMSAKGRKYVSNALVKMPKGVDRLATLNIVVRKSTAEALNSVVKRNNICRDAFFNRVIFLLCCDKKHLATLQLPEKMRDIENDRFTDLETTSIGPLVAIDEILADPFYYLREAIKSSDHDDDGLGLYTFEFPKALVGFSCYINDSHIPGTKEAKQLEEKTRSFNEQFDQWMIELNL